jgi:aminomethyltransferase
MPYYGLMETELAGRPVLISRTGFSGEKGYEVYVRDVSINAEAVWYALRGEGARYGMRVIAPAHHRRIAAGILSYGQDMDSETSPFQVNLGWQVPRKKPGDYIGRAALEAQRAEIEAGGRPFALKLAGMRLGGAPITDYAPDFWLIADAEGRRVGYVTSPWWSPELGENIALGYVPWELSEIGTPLKVELPDRYTERSGEPVDAVVCETPFRPSETPSTRERARAEGRDWAE